MKSWFSKWKISAALDSRQPLPESLRRKIDADPELQRFTQRAQALGETLRSLPPSGPPLHDSIMRAVRSTARRDQPRRAPVLWWATASGAVAAVAVFCILHFTILRPKNLARQALDGSETVREIIENMPATVPSLAMSPLSNEWVRVDHDLQDTAQVLLASLP